MNNTQSYYGENARWVVEERYFGKFDSVGVICTCNTLSQSIIIIDAMVSARKGRCFEYAAIKIADDFISECDSVFETDLFTGETIDNSKYLNGISCLSQMEV